MNKSSKSQPNLPPVTRKLQSGHLGPLLKFQHPLCVCVCVSRNKGRVGGSGAYKELKEQALPLYKVKDSKEFIISILASSVIIKMRQVCLLSLCK